MLTPWAHRRWVRQPGYYDLGPDAYTDLNRVLDEAEVACADKRSEGSLDRLTGRWRIIRQTVSDQPGFAGIYETVSLHGKGHF